jgi:nucleoside-diphosphate-sugar epimerase
MRHFRRHADALSSGLGAHRFGLEQMQVKAFGVHLLPDFDQVAVSTLHQAVEHFDHIHADDLARACLAALWRGRPQRVYNVNDDSCLKMGDYFDLAADVYGLPRPPRVARDTAREQLSLMLLSFMSESRRMDNARLKRELRLTLRYPTVAAGLS